MQGKLISSYSTLHITQKRVIKVTVANNLMVLKTQENIHKAVLY